MPIGNYGLILKICGLAFLTSGHGRPSAHAEQKELDKTGSCNFLCPVFPIFLFFIFSMHEVAPLGDSDYIFFVVCQRFVYYTPR